MLRDFCIKAEDVHLFMHDSAAYMEPAATRLRVDKGYKNLVSLPCWAHILNKMGEVMMDGDSLIELEQYFRLSRLLFARFSLFFWFVVCSSSCALQVAVVVNEMGATPRSCRP